MGHRARRSLTVRSERGAAAVEMALVLPVLILFIGGIVDFSRAYYTQIMLTNAAREGTRAAIVLADPVARANAAGVGVAGWKTPVVETGPLSGTGWVVNAAGCSGTTPPEAVRVTTSATFNYTFLSYLPFITNPTTLSSKSVMGC